MYANGTVEEIEKSLAVNMVNVTKNGITYIAAQNVPSSANGRRGPGSRDHRIAASPQRKRIEAAA